MLAETDPRYVFYHYCVFYLKTSQYFYSLIMMLLINLKICIIHYMIMCITNSGVLLHISS